MVRDHDTAKNTLVRISLLAGAIQLIQMQINQSRGNLY